VGLSKLQKIGFSLVGVFLTTLIFVILFRLDSEKFPFKKYFIWGFSAIVVIFVSFLLIRWFLGFINKPEEVRLQKELVGTEIAKKVWKGEFMALTGIPYYVKGEYKEPIYPESIRIRSCKPIVPSRTPDVYYGFEFEALMGTHTGIHSVFFPLDKGKEGVKNNCMMWLDMHSTLTTSKPNANEWNSPVSHNQLMEVERINAERLGYSFDDANDYERLKIQGLSPQPVQKVEEKKPVEEVFNVTPNDDDNDEGDEHFTVEDYRKP
jgi:hypothetical protein